MKAHLTALGLAAAGAAAAPLVESPDGRTALETPARTPAELARRCEALFAQYKKPSPDGAAELFFCLSHPNPHVRLRALWAMDASAPMQREDFETTFLPRLQEAVRIGTADPNLDVRYAAGDLSRSLQHWLSDERWRRPRPAPLRLHRKDSRLLGVVAAIALLLWPRRKRRRRRSPARTATRASWTAPGTWPPLPSRPSRS